MGRILAIDYGKKRVGIAVSDPLKIIANGLTTVPTPKLMEFLQDYLSKNEVETIIVGLPRQNNNEYSESFKYIKPFVDRLKKVVSVPVVYHDERYTSVLAHRAMLDGGLKKSDRQDKALVDKVSATIILQSYMSSVDYLNLTK